MDWLSYLKSWQIEILWKERKKLHDIISQNLLVFVLKVCCWCKMCSWQSSKDNRPLGKNNSYLDKKYKKVVEDRRECKSHFVTRPMPAITQLSRIKSDLFFTWTLLAASATRILDREEKKSLRPKICWGPQYMSKGDWHGFKFSFWKSAKKSCKWNQIGLKSKKLRPYHPDSWQIQKFSKTVQPKTLKFAISATRKFIFFKKKNKKHSKCIINNR